MSHILLVSREKGVFKELEAPFLQNRITTQWTDMGEKALAMVSGNSFDLVLIHEQLPDMTGKKLVEEIIMKNAMLNCVVLSPLPEHDFHEVYEGLGVLMQFPLKPGRADIEKLMHHLERIRRIAEQVKSLKGDREP